jgi:C-methyltransferase
MSANAKAPPAQLARFVERVRHHLYRLHQRLVPAPVALSELVVGAWVAQAVHAAAELGIADALADFPRWPSMSWPAVSRRIQTHSRGFCGR